MACCCPKVNEINKNRTTVVLAYALLVAALESLAQNYDGFEATWADVAQQKREPVDAALRGAPEDVATKVRTAILKTEHAALSRRFREFVVANIASSFFRDEAVGSSRPIQRAELIPALGEAYKLRSKYVHTLRELPLELRVAVTEWDVLSVDGRPVLTFRGLARLARHVITQFVRTQPKVALEPLNYWSELPGLIRARMANRYWIWRADLYTPRTARRHLSAFLEDAAHIWQGIPDAAFTAMPDVLDKIEQTVRGFARAEQRLPMVTLYFLYHQLIGDPAGDVDPPAVRFLEPHLALFDPPSPESMITHVLMDQETEWSAGQFATAWQDYLAQRLGNHALVLPRLYEAACLLTLAELHRREGDAAKMRESITAAVETMPGDARLLDFENIRRESGLEESIEWRDVLPRAP